MEKIELKKQLVEMLKTTRDRHDGGQCIYGLSKFINQRNVDCLSRSNGKETLKNNFEAIEMARDIIIEEYLKSIHEPYNFAKSNMESEILNGPLDDFMAKFFANFGYNTKKASDILNRIISEAKNPIDVYRICGELPNMTFETQNSLNSLCQYLSRERVNPGEYVSNVLSKNFNEIYLDNDPVKQYTKNVIYFKKEEGLKNASALEYGIYTSFVKLKSDFLDHFPNESASQINKLSFDKIIERMSEAAHSNGIELLNAFTRSYDARKNVLDELKNRGLKSIRELFEQEIKKPLDIATAQHQKTKKPRIINERVNQLVVQRVRDVISGAISRKNKNSEKASHSAQTAIMNGYNINYENAKMYTQSISKMAATTGIGMIRGNQEDAVLLIEHPDNPDYKMMVVADGMGGVDNGEYASNYTTLQLADWFKRVDSKRLEHIESGLSHECADEIKRISKDIAGEAKKRGVRAIGTTAVCAIFGKNQTLVENVGDSRAYIVKKDGKLEQVTMDDSPLAITFTSEEMRFHPNSNIITKYIGQPDLIDVNSRIINNKDFDFFMAASDGVTDFLGEKKMQETCIGVITRNSKMKDIARAITEAITSRVIGEKPEIPESVLRSLTRKGIAPKNIKQAGDNHTIAVYDNRDER